MSKRFRPQNQHVFPRLEFLRRRLVAQFALIGERPQTTHTMTILHLDSSPRGERSHSRQLTRAFVQELQQKHPDATVVYRDLGHNPPSHVDETWIAATYSDPSTHGPDHLAALKESEELIAEIIGADLIVVGVPMYNFSIPSTLKAYIDQIVRPGRTFAYPSYEGLVTGKKMFLLQARGGGGYSPGEQMAGVNFQDPYLKAIFGLIGIKDISVVNDNKTLSNESDLDGSIDKAKQTADSVA